MHHSRETANCRTMINASDPSVSRLFLARDFDRPSDLDNSSTRLLSAGGLLMLSGRNGQQLRPCQWYSARATFWQDRAFFHQIAEYYSCLVITAGRQCLVLIQGSAVSDGHADDGIVKLYETDLATYLRYSRIPKHRCSKCSRVFFNSEQLRAHKQDKHAY